MGKNYSGYRHAINSNAIMHIENRHGEHGEQDSSMSNPKDIARIQYILDNYDSVELASEKEGEYSKEFRDKNDKPMRKIVYKKKINGTYYLVEAVGENAYKKLWVVSAYINKKGELTEGSASDIISQQNTPEALLPSHSSTPIIRENSEKSTENAKNSSKNSNRRYSIDVNSPKLQREMAWTKALSKYAHRINLSADMKAAIIKQYGKERAKRLFDVWESKSNIL